MNAKISIIIVTWNSREYISACLESVKKSIRDYDYEIILFDNNSTDDTAGLVSENYPDVNVMKGRMNHGFSKGNNIAYENVDKKAELVLLLNPDTKVEGDAINQMADYLLSHADVGCVGPALLNKDASTQRSTAGGFPTAKRAFNEMFFLARLFKKSKHFEGMYIDEADEPVTADWASGACLMLKHSVVGGRAIFDEEIFMYGEDVDLCLRIKAAGKKTVYLPTARVYHYQGRSLIQQDDHFFKSFDNGLFMLVKKRLGTYNYFLVKGIIFLGCWIRIIAHYILWKLGSKQAHDKLRIIYNFMRAHFN